MHEQMRSLPALFRPNERIDPNVPENILDINSFIDLIFNAQMKDGHFFAIEMDQSNSFNLRSKDNYLLKVIVQNHTNTDPLNIIGQVVGLSRSIVSVLLIPLTNSSNNTIRLFETECNLCIILPSYSPLLSKPFQSPSLSMDVP